MMAPQARRRPNHELPSPVRGDLGVATSAGFRAAADVPSAPWTPEGGMHSRGGHALPWTPEGAMHSGRHVEVLVRLAGRVQGRGGRVGVVKAPVGCTGEPS